MYLKSVYNMRKFMFMVGCIGLEPSSCTTWSSQSTQDDGTEHIVKINKELLKDLHQTHLLLILLLPILLPCQNQQPQHLWLFPKVLHHPQHPFSPKQSRQNKTSIFAEYMFNNFP